MEYHITEKYKSRNITLKSIIEPISEEMEHFKKVFKTSMRTDIFLVNRIAGYMVSRRGKMVRPILVFLSGKAFNPPNHNTVASALLIELLHTATLMHDDVVDRSERRRGIASINSLWRNKISVLMGDFLFSRALIHLISLKDFEALEVLSRTAERMSKGELLQMDKSSSKRMDEETYIQMIGDKTASLFSAACELGAITTSGKPEHRKAMADYGECLGVAFQLKDDIFNFTGKRNIIGKPAGGDVKENLITLPVIHALSNGSRRSGRDLIKNLRNGRRNGDFKRALDFVKEMGGIDYTIKRLKHFSSMAEESLSEIADGPVKDSLIDFIHFNIKRDR